MNVTTQDKKLNLYISNYAKAVKELGKKRADLLQIRLAQMYIVDSLEDLRFVPGHFHELTGDRKGQWPDDISGSKLNETLSIIDGSASITADIAPSVFLVTQRQSYNS